MQFEIYIKVMKRGYILKKSNSKKNKTKQRTKEKQQKEQT